MRRSAAEGQGELFSALPTPAPGTVAIMRIEDWQRLSGARGAVAVTNGQQTPAQQRKLKENSAIERLVLDWLRGTGDPVSYGTDTSRTGDGRVTSTTCEEVVGGIKLPSELSLSSSTVSVGMLLAANGWNKRYLTAQDRKRKRFYFAPDNWLAMPST